LPLSKLAEKVVRVAREPFTKEFLKKSIETQLSVQLIDIMVFFWLNF